MKTITLFSIIAFLITGFSACKQNNVDPQKKINSTLSPLDTSTTLITNTSLLGTWNVITDSVSFRVDTMYHGKDGDSYIFTKYGNIYAKCAFNQFIDTGVYTISQDTMRWVSLYVTEAGSIIRSPVMTAPYVISNLTATSLVLTQYDESPDGLRYEKITFKKAQ
jgi:hypothetical protein